MTPKSIAPLPTLTAAPAPPPAFGANQSPGQKPGTKNPTPTFLGASSVPSAAQRGTKTLVGQ